MRKLNNIKWLSLGVILTLVISLLIVPAFAAAWSKEATLNYRDIKITLDGNAVVPKDANGNTVEPFIIDGTTYLPVRGVASALGLGVEWDAATSTVKLSTSGSSPTAPPQPSTSYSRTNPAPIGTAQTITVGTYTSTYTATVALKETIRGNEAWNMIKEANQFNDNAKDGYEYILAKVKITMNNIENDQSVDVTPYMFDCFSSGDAEYTDILLVVTPSPSFSGSLYSGASTEGWVVFMVAKDDTSPKCVFEVGYNGSGGIWFALD